MQSRMYKATLHCIYSFILKLSKYRVASTNKSKLETLLRIQKYASRIIYLKDQFTLALLKITRFP